MFLRNPSQSLYISMNPHALTSRVMLFDPKTHKRHQSYHPDIITRPQKERCSVVSAGKIREARTSCYRRYIFSQSPIFFFLCIFISSPGSMPEAAQHRAAWPWAYHFPVWPWHLHPQLWHSRLLQEKAGTSSTSSSHLSDRKTRKGKK